MKNISTIAINTFKESIRDKIFYTIGFFAVLFAVILFFIGTASLGEEAHVLRAIGLGGIYLFGIVLTLSLSSSLLSREFEKKTIYFIFSRPVSSLEMTVGKFFGLFLTISAAMFIFSLVYFVMVFFGASLLDFRALLALFLEWCEMLIFIALVLFFSSLTRPSIAVIAATTILYLGHSSTLLLKTAQDIGGVFHSVMRIFFFIFPDLEKFNIRASIIYDLPLSSSELSLTVLYAACLIIFFLVLASLFLKKREL